MVDDLNPMMARFQDQPALLDEGRSAWLQACMSQVAVMSEELAKVEVAATDDFWFDPDDYRSYFRPYKVRDGILHVPVRGVLLNNFPFALGDWATGYEYIWEAVKRGLADSNVRGIALVIDSGGGMVAGNFDLNDRIYGARGTKPIRAFAAEHAYSAAYSIASTADSITVARTGGVGSIGVVVVHMEMSRRLDEMGVTTTIIRSKPSKMEGNAYEALSEDARARIQANVDELHSEFVSLVARNRGMSVEEVDATNALTFTPKQAIENGLADEIGALDDALTAFVASFNPEGDEPMADTPKADQNEAMAQAVADATATAKADGVKQERARVSAILTCDAAKSRPNAAIKFATSDKFAVLDAAAIMELLADLPEEKVQAETPAGGAAPTGMLKAAMRGEGGGAGIVAETESEDSAEAQQPSRAERARALVNL